MSLYLLNIIGLVCQIASEYANNDSGLLDIISQFSSTNFILSLFSNIVSILLTTFSWNASVSFAHFFQTTVGAIHLSISALSFLFNVSVPIFTCLSQIHTIFPALLDIFHRSLTTSAYCAVFSNIVPAFHHTLPAVSNIHAFAASIHNLNHKSDAPHATLENFQALAHILVRSVAAHNAHILVAHFAHRLVTHFTSPAHHSAIANTSDAVQVGSVSIVFANHSRLPYLSPSACLHSLVATNLYNQAIVSNGLVNHLATAVIVFNALPGIFANIFIVLGHSVHTATN